MFELVSACFGSMLAVCCFCLLTMFLFTVPSVLVVTCCLCLRSSLFLLHLFLGGGGGFSRISADSDSRPTLQHICCMPDSRFKGHSLPSKGFNSAPPPSPDFVSSKAPGFLALQKSGILEDFLVAEIGQDLVHSMKKSVFVGRGLLVKSL